MLSTAIFVFAATAPVNGYFGGSLYSRYTLHIHTLLQQLLRRQSTPAAHYTSFIATNNCFGDSLLQVHTSHIYTFIHGTSSEAVLTPGTHAPIYVETHTPCTHYTNEHT